MSPPRILLCGDVMGRLDQLHKRVASVNKSSGPFDALFCVGQFFPNEQEGVQELREYLEDQKAFLLPTYFIGNYGEQAAELLAAARSKAKDLGSMVEPIPVCKNLFWLKGSGAVIVNGLRIAYLGGKFDPQGYEDDKHASEAGSFHRDDVDALRALADEPQVVDMFLTNEWPRGVLTGSPDQNPPEEITGNPIVSELASELKPRYHVAGSGNYFCNREPYSNEGVSHVTRFVALATVGNDKKQKYIHALSPTPAANLSSEELAVTPPNTTPCPYQEQSFSKSVLPKKRPMPETSSAADSEGQYWRFQTADGKKQKRVEGACFDFMSKGSCSRGEACKFKHTLENGMPIPRKSCYDFLTKGSCERGSECRFHHVTEDTTEQDTPPPGTCFHFFRKGFCDKGDSCRFAHTTAAKPPPGPCWFCLSSPNVESHLVVSVGDHSYCTIAKGPLLENHILIIPIEHLSCTISAMPEMKSEFAKYKDSLRKLFESQGKAMIVFERYINLRSGTHAHLQVLPIPLEVASGAADAFQSAAKDLGFTFIVFPSGSPNYELKRFLDGVNYFFVELPDGSVLAHPCGAGERMPMQFGREVAAKLLDLPPEKADWKSSTLSKEQETKLAEVFKQQFAAYDFTQA